MGLAWMAEWPEWLVWCAVGAAAVFARVVVVYVIESTIETSRS
jgi:hypothetical protein